MDFLSLALRASMPSDAVYVPFDIVGDDWPDKEVAQLSAYIKDKCGERVDAMFNNWRFNRVDAEFYIIKRATWDTPSVASSFDALMTWLREYYHEEE